MKYITYKCFRDRVDKFVIFDKITNHSDMAKGLTAEEILGAGFVGFGDDGARCYGESVTLNMKSRGEKDSKIIQRHRKGGL